MNERVNIQQKVSMSAINSINSRAPYTPPPVSVPQKAKTDSSAPTPQAVQEPAKAPVEGATQNATAAAATKSAAAANALSYRNAFGDTVSITNIVLKDRDGDGGVGLPAAKVKAPESSVQGK
jgi:hypothetical protein